MFYPTHRGVGVWGECINSRVLKRWFDVIWSLSSGQVKVRDGKGSQTCQQGNEQDPEKWVGLT